MSWGSVGRRGQRRRRASRRPRPRERDAARRDEGEARVLALLAHAGHALETRAAARAGSGCGLPHAERAQPLELLGQLEAERAAGHDGVHPLAAGSGPPGDSAAAGVRGQRAPERLQRRRRRSSTPAAIRWPPKRVRCAAQASSPA